MDKFMKGVKDLEDGVYEEKTIFHPQCFGLGEMTGYSFAALCVFTGLCRSQSALEVATWAHKYSKANYDREIGRMLSEIGEKEGREELLKYKEKDYYKGKATDGIKWYSLYKCLAQLLLEQRHQDGENVLCAVGRDKEQPDIFAYGQDLYTIRQGRSWMKSWGGIPGGKHWEDFIGQRTRQRKSRRERLMRNESILPAYIRLQEDVPTVPQTVV
jgi:hypothetical protein